MNYLAHIYLARHSPDAQFGALLGDFVKIQISEDFTPETVREIQIHRKIDSYTDSHPITQEARALFEGGRRRYAGILLDVFYDHVLAANWFKYSERPLPQFVADFYRELLARQSLLPERLAYAAPYMVKQDWLGSYRDFDGVRTTIQRMSHRLSRDGDLFRTGIQDLEKHYEHLSAGFERFFPDLIQYAQDQRIKLAE